MPARGELPGLTERDPEFKFKEKTANPRMALWRSLYRHSLDADFVYDRTNGLRSTRLIPYVEIDDLIPPGIMADDDDFMRYGYPLAFVRAGHIETFAVTDRHVRVVTTPTSRVESQAPGLSVVRFIPTEAGRLAVHLYESVDLVDRTMVVGAATMRNHVECPYEICQNNPLEEDVANVQFTVDSLHFSSYAKTAGTISIPGSNHATTLAYTHPNQVGHPLSLH